MDKIKTLIFIMIIFSGCYIDVMHDSKVDPDNPFGVGFINISIKNINGDPVNSAEIIINNDTMFTDSLGIIEEYEIINDTVIITIKKDGYRTFHSDTVINIGEHLNYSINLNRIPVIQDVFLNSSVEFIRGIVDTFDYSVNIGLFITEYDGNNDMDSCYMNIFNEIVFLDFLYDSNGSICYEKLFDEDYELFSIFDIQGEQVSLKIADKSGERDSIDNLFLIRFVEYIPIVTKPIDGMEFFTPDTIKWECDIPPYNTFTLFRIFDSEGNCFINDTLDINTNSFIIDTLFRSGEYEMIINIIDNYGNYSGRNVFFTIP